MRQSVLERQIGTREAAVRPNSLSLNLLYFKRPDLELVEGCANKDRLPALLSLTLTRAFVVGLWQASVKALKLKKPGYPPKSVFRRGLNVLYRLVANLERASTLSSGGTLSNFCPVVRSSRLIIFKRLLFAQPSVG